MSPTAGEWDDMETLTIEEHLRRKRVLGKLRPGDGDALTDWYSTRTPKSLPPEASEIEARLRLGETGAWGRDSTGCVVWFAMSDTFMSLPPAPSPFDADPAARPDAHGDRPRLHTAVRIAAVLGYGNGAEGRLQFIKLVRERFAFSERKLP